VRVHCCEVRHQTSAEKADGSVQVAFIERPNGCKELFGIMRVLSAVRAGLCNGDSTVDRPDEEEDRVGVVREAGGSISGVEAKVAEVPSVDST